MAQLPAGAEGIAAGVLTYSSICLLLGCLVIWLVWVHHDRASYVSFLAYFTTVSTLSSIIQQTRAVLYWNDIMLERTEYAKSEPGNPELLISNGAVGIELVLFYIQFYCYNVQALFVMFWAFHLAQLVYGLYDKPRFRRPLRIVNLCGKIFSVTFPLITTCSLQSPMMRKDLSGFLLLAGQPLFWSIGLGTLAVLAILLRYIQSRRKLQQLQLSYGKSSVSSSAASKNTKQGIYDRWLMTRFVIAFVILTVFEVTIVLFSFNARRNVEADIIGTSPDYSVERAKSDFLLFMPGVTASLLLFLVFGTTLPFLKYIGGCFRRNHGKTLCTSQDMTPLRSLPSRDDGMEDIGVSQPEESHQNFRQSRIIQVPENKAGVWVYTGTPPAEMMVDNRSLSSPQKPLPAGSTWPSRHG